MSHIRPCPTRAGGNTAWLPTTGDCSGMTIGGVSIGGVSQMREMSQTITFPQRNVTLIRISNAFVSHEFTYYFFAMGFASCCPCFIMGFAFECFFLQANSQPAPYGPIHLHPGSPLPPWHAQDCLPLLRKGVVDWGSGALGPKRAWGRGAWTLGFPGPEAWALGVRALCAWALEAWALGAWAPGT